MNDHRVFHGGVSQDVRAGVPAFLLLDEGVSGATGHVEPDRLSRRGEGRMRDRQSQGFGDNLRRRRGAEELAAAAGRGARLATEIGGFVERDEAMRKASADGLDLARVFAVNGWQG